MAEGGFNEALFKRVDELDLLVRSANCLQNAGIEYIWQLVEKTEAELLKTKNFGRKSLFEIKEILADLGLKLGMRLDHFPNPKVRGGGGGNSHGNPTLHQGHHSPHHARHTTHNDLHHRMADAHLWASGGMMGMSSASAVGILETVLMP